MYGSPYYKPYWLKDNELEHYGVKGMKWGIRKDEETPSKNSKKALFSLEKSSGTTYVPNDKLKAAYLRYEQAAKNNYNRILLEKRLADPKYSDPVTVSDSEPMWKQAYAEASKNLKLDDESRALLAAYAALEDAMIAKYFDVGFKTINGKKQLICIHRETRKQFTTISAAIAYMKSAGARTREKNVESEKAVSVKVNKNKSAGNKNSMDKNQKQLLENVGINFMAEKSSKAVISAGSKVTSSVLKKTKKFASKDSKKVNSSIVEKGKSVIKGIIGGRKNSKNKR